MNTIRFDAAMSRRVESAYTTPDVVEQRRIVVGALSLQPGERVLDIGSGPASSPARWRRQSEHRVR
jgi:precorrin-6B methylase 2